MNKLIAWRPLSGRSELARIPFATLTTWPVSRRFFARAPRTGPAAASVHAGADACPYARCSRNQPADHVVRNVEPFNCQSREDDFCFPRQEQAQHLADERVVAQVYHFLFIGRSRRPVTNRSPPGSRLVSPSIHARSHRRASFLMATPPDRQRGRAAYQHPLIPTTGRPSTIVAVAVPFLLSRPISRAHLPNLRLHFFSHSPRPSSQKVLPSWSIVRRPSRFLMVNRRAQHSIFVLGVHAETQLRAPLADSHNPPASLQRVICRMQSCRAAHWRTHS